MTMATFQIAAEYLHTLVGRQVALPAGGALGAAIPLTIAAVRHEPESGSVVVDADAIVHQIVGWKLAPGTLVNVQHERDAEKQWSVPGAAA